MILCLYIHYTYTQYTHTHTNICTYQQNSSWICKWKLFCAWKLNIFLYYNSCILCWAHDYSLSFSYTSNAYKCILCCARIGKIKANSILRNLYHWNYITNTNTHIRIFLYTFYFIYFEGLSFSFYTKFVHCILYSTIFGHHFILKLFAPTQCGCEKNKTNFTLFNRNNKKWSLTIDIHGI